MNRLTNPLIVPKTGEVLAYNLNPGVTDTQVKTKLGKYEDLEEQCIKENAFGIRLLLEKWKEFFEDIQELAEYRKLKEQGRLLILPCVVGDIVYYEHPYSSVHTGIQAYQITNIMISQNKKGAWTKKYRAMMLLNGKIIDSQINFSFDDIGKTVFLTKAEAEAALEKMKGEEHE